MNDEILQEKIKILWLKANIHSFSMIGEAISDGKITDAVIPERPSDEEVLTLVSEYLQGSM
jgi:hypothetical protein